ncbi:MAG: hypothetical protein ACREPM_25590 [Gemmatimonadaceae bacterium]
MIELLEQALLTQRLFDDEAWKSCIIGGLAVIRWGQPRLTRGVDVSLFTGFGDERRIAERILAQLEPRVVDAIECAAAHRVLLARTHAGTPVDIAFAGYPFEAEIIERSTTYRYTPDVELRNISAEDLVVLKAFANRRQDWGDIAGIAARQASLDWRAIFERLAPLVELKAEPAILDELRSIQRGG